MKSKMADSKAFINDFIKFADPENMGVDPKSETVSAIIMEILHITGLTRQPYWNSIWWPQGGPDFWAPPQKSIVCVYTLTEPNLVLS